VSLLVSQLGGCWNRYLCTDYGLACPEVVPAAGGEDDFARRFTGEEWRNHLAIADHILIVDLIEPAVLRSIENEGAERRHSVELITPVFVRFRSHGEDQFGSVDCIAVIDPGLV
jgi:hypothetical protein